MLRGLLVGGLVSLNLFAGSIQTIDSLNNHSDQTSETNSFSNFFKVRQQALPADQQTENNKETLKTELQNHLQKQENQKAEEETKKKRQEKVDEWKKSLPKLDENSHMEKFVNEISEEAVRIAHEQGIFPSVMIAQASLESNWGRSGLAQEYNNLMGTKGSWEGKTVMMNTGENVGGANIRINAGFSVYDSWGDSLARYGSLLRNGTQSNSDIYSGTWRENANSYKDATAWLEGRYATDPNYSSKLNQTIESLNLDQFDDVEVLTEEKLEEINVEPEKIDYSLSIPEGVVEVQENDSLQSIASENDISTEEIMEWNQLEEPAITVGQLLTVSEDTDPISIENLDDIEIDEKAKMFL